MGPLGAPALRLAGRALGTRPSHRRLDRAVETLAVRDELLRWASWFRTFSPPDLEQLLAPDLRRHASPDALTAPLARALAPYASLEGRMPLLDYRIVERVANVPNSARAGLRSAKAILREAVRDLVPEEVLRQPKRGFPVPIARFLAEDSSLREL